MKKEIAVLSVITILSLTIAITSTTLLLTKGIRQEQPERISSGETWFAAQMAYEQIGWLRDDRYSPRETSEMLDWLYTYYHELCLSYALCLADTRDNADACALLYWTVKGIYQYMGEEMSQNTFDFLFEYVKRGAEQQIKDGCYTCAPNCVAAMSIIYKEGKYVPQDLALAEKYEKILDSLEYLEPMY